MSGVFHQENLTGIALAEVKDRMQAIRASGARAASCVRQENGRYDISAIFTAAAQKAVFDLSGDFNQAVYTQTDIAADKVAGLMDAFHHEGANATCFTMQDGGQYSVSAVFSKPAQVYARPCVF